MATPITLVNLYSTLEPFDFYKDSASPALRASGLLEPLYDKFPTSSRLQAVQAQRVVDKLRQRTDGTGPHRRWALGTTGNRARLHIARLAEALGVVSQKIGQRPRPQLVIDPIQRADTQKLHGKPVEWSMGDRLSQLQNQQGLPAERLSSVEDALLSAETDVSDSESMRRSHIGYGRHSAAEVDARRSAAHSRRSALEADGRRSAPQVDGRRSAVEVDGRRSAAEVEDNVRSRRLKSTKSTKF